MFKDKGCFILITLIILAVVLSVVTLIQVYPVYTEIDSQLKRAQVSSSMLSMAENLEKVRVGMVINNVTSGHAAMVFKTPLNDVGEDYKAIVALRDRAISLAKSDPNSIEYNVGLDDLRGTVREIQIEAYYYAAIRNPFYWISILLWVFIAIFFVVWESS